MRNRLLARITFLFVLSLTSSACSWVFVNAPPTNHADLDFFTCTQSKLAPVLDVGWAGFSALGVTFGLLTSDEELQRDYDISKAQLIGFYAPFVVLNSLSARSGFKKVSACKDATASLAARLNSSSSAAPQTPDLEALKLDLEALNWRLPQLLPVRSLFYVPSATENRPKQQHPGGN